MPHLSHLKKSFELLSESEAIELVRQTRRDRESWVKPVAAKKPADGIGPAKAKAPRKSAAAGTKKRATKKSAKADPMAVLASMPREQQLALMAKMGIKL